MSPLRVMVLTTSYPLTATSYSGIFIRRMIDHLPADIQTTVVAPAARIDVAPPRPNNTAIRLFRYAPKRLQILAHEPGGIPVALRSKPWTYFLLPSFLISMLLYCLWYARRTDVIHANWSICGFIAGVAGSLWHVPVVTTLRGEDVTRAQRRLIDRIVLHLCLRLSAYAVVVSPSMEPWLSHCYPHLAHKIRIVENGIDDELLQLSRRESSRSAQNPLRLLTVGSLIPRKRIDRTINAMGRLPALQQVHLTIAGSGPERESLQRLASATGLAERIQFVGAVDPQRVAGLLAQADVFILTSHSEGRPNAILEAMGAALPVLATDIDGVRDVVEHDTTGLLHREDDASHLAAHISRLCQDSALCRQLGENGRRRIIERGLSWRNTARKYTALYQLLVEKNRGTKGTG